MFKIKSVMSTNILTVSPDTDIYDAIRILVDHNVTGLPVVDGNQAVLGILSEKDVLALMVNAEDKPGRVADYMTVHPICFDQNDSLIEVAECFIDNHFRRVPIVADGKLVGILSRRDIVRFIMHLRHKG